MTRASEFFKELPKFAGAFAEPSELPRAPLPEIAFIGRSNVGKSSLINALWRAPLAKTSATPGRTQTINFFKGGRFSVVDLPGYGYAAAPKKLADSWQARTRDYFLARDQLREVLVLVDSRLSPGPLDHDLIEFLAMEGIPYQIVLTKADKKGASASLPGAIATSAEKGAGLEALRAHIFGLLTCPAGGASIKL